MNITRIAILGVAAIAAGAAALLVRGMVGGGTQPAEAGPPAHLVTTEVLVAARAIEPGRALTSDAVQWQAWPKTAIADGFITKDARPDIETVIKGMVSRAPMVDGEPVTEAKIVRAENASFMAATIKPGNRGISIPVTAETGAGGFILPNDRVDVILTLELDVNGVKVAKTKTVLRDVRVLAIDQVLKQEDDQQSVVAKTATLEVTPKAAELVAQAGSMGKLSVALRALGDDVEVVDLAGVENSEAPKGTNVTVIRYGLTAQQQTVPGVPAAAAQQ
jgi:pilus assembly protein CpaB